MGLLTKLFTPPAAGGPKKSSLLIDGDEVPVTLRRNRNARRYILRLDEQSQGVVITVPASGSERQAMEFAASHGVWIRKQLASATDNISFADGNTVPLRDTDYLIVHQLGKRGTVWLAAADKPEIHVAGGAEHIARRVKDWLKSEARRDLLEASIRYARLMDTKFTRVSVRDQSTRWGSCSSAGTLSYSWRLIFTPPFVLDYVAAHEVAHLLEMNHGPRFWSQVKAHCPATDRARRWLKTHGRELHKFG